MFGSKSTQIEALTGQVADLNGVVADYEQHSGYLEVARRIHEEHVGLIGSMIGASAVVGTDAYDTAVEVVRSQELTKAKNTAVETIIAGKREDIVAKLIVDLMDDESVQADAAQVIDSADYQARLAEEARHQAVERIITLRKEAEADMYAELLKGHLRSELERARKIAALNFEFSANGILDFSNERLRPILENGDKLEVKAVRPDGLAALVQFVWIQTDAKMGFIYQDWQILNKDNRYSLHGSNLPSNFWTDKPLLQMGSVVGSAGFDPILIKAGKLCVKTEEQQSAAQPAEYGRIYLALTNGYSNEATTNKTRLTISGINLTQRRFAPDITDATA